ncbi:MAG: ATP synthase F1 subunit epsilon [Melioribacteraceae bacterium]|nr:ATP synthase F1 subunit epsilon [Melioribacteraceae bacterium]
MKTLNIDVITPSKVVYSSQANSVTIPGSAGSFQVLYNHAPILSTFETGIVKIEENNGTVYRFATGGGTVEVLKNKVLLLAESFERPEEIDVKRAREAMERARRRLSKEAQQVEKVDLARAEAALKRAVNRLKLSGDYKN